MSKHHHEHESAESHVGNEPARVDPEASASMLLSRDFPPANATNASVTEDAEAVESETSETKKRKHYAFDLDAWTVTISDPVTEESTAYDLNAMPTPVLRHLSLVGLVTTLRVSKDAAAAFSDMMLGNLPGRSPKTPNEAKAKARDRWREAVAYYLMTQDAIIGKREPEGSYEFMTVETARSIADGYTRQQMTAAKDTLGVIKQYAKLAETAGETE